MVLCACITSGFVFVFFDYGVYLNYGFLCIGEFGGELGVEEDPIAAFFWGYFYHR